MERKGEGIREGLKDKGYGMKMIFECRFSIAFPTPPRMCCPVGDVRVAKRGVECRFSIEREMLREVNMAEKNANCNRPERTR